MKEKKELEKEDFLKELIGNAKSVPEERNLFEGEEFEHEEEGINVLEIFEHGDLSTGDGAFENPEKALEKEQETEKDHFGNGDSEVFEKLAKLRGITKEEMKEELLWALEKANLEKMTNEIMGNNPGINRKIAEELARFRLNEEKPREEKNESENWDGKLKELDDFLSGHSGEAIEKLDLSVVEEWEGGIPIEKAFEKFMLKKENERLSAELEMLKKEMAREEQRAYAREHSPDSATSAAGLAVHDEFIEGLFKEY